MQIKRIHSKIKNRNLFIKGDVIRYRVKYSHNTWYDEYLSMIVAEDEIDKKFSGVFVNRINYIFQPEDYVIFKLNDKLHKGTIVYNTCYTDYKKSMIHDIKNSFTKNIEVVNVKDILAFNIKEYIVELDENYYKRLNRHESINGLLQ